MNNEIKISFALRNDFIEEDGRTIIYALIRTKDFKTQKILNVRALVDRWNRDEGRMPDLTFEDKMINNTLDEFCAMITLRYRELVIRGETITPELLKNAKGQKNHQNMTFMELCDMYINSLKESSHIPSQMDMYRRYTCMQKRLRMFLLKKHKKDDMPLAKINTMLINNFKTFLKDNFPMGEHKLLSYIHWFRMVYNVAYNSGWVNKNPFPILNYYHTPIKDRYLTKEELQSVIDTQMPTERLEKVKDIFLFSCLTGLAYTDLVGLRLDMIKKENDKRLWISARRAKTDTLYKIRLTDRVLQIIDKYKPEDGKGIIFRQVQCNPKYNKQLRKAMVLCGITRWISLHMARHTFAVTVNLHNGVPIETIAALMGHSDIRATQTYIQITDEVISNEIYRVNHILNLQLR